MSLTQEEMDGLRQVDRLTRERPFAWQLKCKQLLCGVFVTMLCRLGQQPSGQTDFSSLSRLEDMLAFLHSRYDQPLGLTVTEAALQCGFSNAGRFSAAFARRMHMTPKAYRQLQHCKPANGD